MAKREKIVSSMTDIPSGDGMPVAAEEHSSRYDCTTYLLRPYDFVIEAVTTSSGHALPAALIGRPLTEYMAHARGALIALLTQVATTGKPVAALLPALVPDRPAQQCVCNAINDQDGALTHIACTLVHGASVATAPMEDVSRATASIRQAATEALPLYLLLDQVVEAAHRLIHADATQIALINMTMPRDLRCEVRRGVGQADLAGLPLSRQSLAGRVLKHNRPRRHSGAELTQAIHHVPGNAWLRRLDASSWLGVPLRIGGQAIGVLMAQRVGASAPFADDDEARLQALVDGVSLAIAETRLREAEADHAQREVVLNRLLDDLPVGVLWVDAELHVLYINQVQQTRMDARMGESLEIGPGEFHPTWRDATTKAPYRWEDLPFIRTIRSGQSVEMLVAPMPPEGGEETEFIVKTHPFHDAQGNVTDVIMVWIDATAQRRASREAIRRAAELDIIIESIADGVIIYNREGAPLRYNPAALEILGWQSANIDPVAITAAERFDTYDLHFISGEPVPPDQLPVTRALAGEITAPLQLLSQRPDGTEVVKSIRAAPLREPTTGAIQGAVIVFRDVTEMQRVEQMKEDFINIASHELRAPLEPLMLASGFIKRWIDRPEHARDVVRLAGEIVSHTRRISRLVAEMLDMTRITSDHFAINAEPSNLTRTILDAIDEHQTIWRRTIITSGLDKPLICLADSERMWQVMTNLLSNASKYSAAPAPIEVQAMVIPATDRGEAARVQIVVRDHGNGIAREHLPYIFSRFYRIMRPESQPGTQTRDGLGLGLFISRAIVTAHDGQIWAESEIGVGSSFYIELAMCDEHTLGSSFDAFSPYA